MTAGEPDERTGEKSLVVLRGDFDHKDFLLINLRTGAGHILAELPAQFVIR